MSGDAPTSSESLILAAEAALQAEALDQTFALADAAERAGAEPDRCAGNRWMAAMLGGDFPRAWAESDAIRKRGGPDPHRFWQGESLAGKRVVLRSLHGFGDAVQMFRFLPRLRAMASHLLVEVPPHFVELAACFDGMGEVITWGEGAPAEPPAWDVQVETMELPYLLRVSAADLQPSVDYLRIPPSWQAAARQVTGTTEARIGVVWTAGHWNPTRSIPLALMAQLRQALGSVPGQAAGPVFWSLEGRSGREQAPALPPGWRDVYELGDGLLPLAAIVERMDLVITVDTLTAHLAGVLGVPCWLMLQHRADWRWMLGRPDSPWYPSLRLWRQQQAGDWAELLGRVGAALRQWPFQNERPALAKLDGR